MQTVSDLSKIYNQYKRKTRFFDYYQTIEFYDNLTMQLLIPLKQNIINEPEASADLLQKVIDGFESLVQSKDDSSGCAMEFLYDCAEIWGLVWAKIQNRNPAILARKIADYYLNHGYLDRGIFAFFQDALGNNGLIELEKYLHDDKSALMTVIRLQNNSDKYITVASQQVGGISNDNRLIIADMLSNKKDYVSAIQWLKQIPHNIASIDLFIKRQELLIRLYFITNNQLAAQEERWRAFRRTLDSCYYWDIIKNANNDEHASVREEAIALACTKDNFKIRLQFLESLKEYQLVEEQILEFSHKLEQDEYSYYRKLSKLLAKHNFLLGAIVLRRFLVEEVLKKAASRNYSYAVSDLKVMLEYGEQVTNWRELLNNSDYAQLLYKQHEKKYSFWQRCAGVLVIKNVLFSFNYGK